MKGTLVLRRLVSASLLALTLVALTACRAADSDRLGAGAPARGAADATVTLVDMSFSPTVTAVGVGEVVTWVWDDRPVEHDVVFGDGPASPRQRTGTWQRAFERPGTYEYVCSLHPSMRGRVFVD